MKYILSGQITSLTILLFAHSHGHLKHQEGRQKKIKNQKERKKKERKRERKKDRKKCELQYKQQVKRHKDKSQNKYNIEKYCQKNT